MTKKEVENKVLDILLHYNSSGILLSNNVKLIEELGLDSITIVEVITLIERAFKITIPDEELSRDNFDSISTVVNYILEKIN